MNQTVNQEWTSFDIEEARSVITKFKINSCSNDDINNNQNKHDIYGELHSWFPWRTMQEVKDLYDYLASEMLLVPYEKKYDGSIGEHSIANTMDGLLDKNFGVQEKASMDGMDCFFGNPVNVMSLVDTKEVPVAEHNRVWVLENKMPIHQPMEAPYTRRFWTEEEHRLFLCGLCAYGRGKWKNISEYFVTTRTPVQIASHAQKYFKKLESKRLKEKRYSINDVELDDVELWKMNNNSSAQQAPTFANADNHNPSFVMQTPSSTCDVSGRRSDRRGGELFPTNEQGSA